MDRYKYTEPEVRAALARYVNATKPDRDKLIDWVIRHFQYVLDSLDPNAIRIVKELDANDIEVGEDLMSEEEFYEAALAIYREPETITLKWSVVDGEPLGS